MENSIVGDPILWPGIVYSPLNRAGLIFALGAAAKSVGLLFEEFSDEDWTAICRRKTEAGWQRIKVAFEVRSSEFVDEQEGIDLLVCWVDDLPDTEGPPRLELSALDFGQEGSGVRVEDRPGQVEAILPQGAADDLRERGRNRENYQEAVRELDERIKRLREA